MLQILDSVPDATRACFLFIARKRSPTITFSHRFGIYIHHYRGRWILVPIVFIRLHIGSGLSGHNPGKRLWNRLLSISFHSQGSLRCVCLARQAQGVYKSSARTHDTSVVRFSSSFDTLRRRRTVYQGRYSCNNYVNRCNMCRSFYSVAF
jgi:hypothetical protein